MNIDTIEWIWQLYEEKPVRETGILAICLLFAEMEDICDGSSGPVAASMAQKGCSP